MDYIVAVTGGTLRHGGSANYHYYCYSMSNEPLEGEKARRFNERIYLEITVYKYRVAHK